MTRWWEARVTTTSTAVMMQTRFMAVMATTLSLVVIFLPVVFITGQIGQYLFSFGVVSAAAILFSMFVSFTLTPALCSLWLRPNDVGHTGSKNRGFYAKMDRVYGHMLHWSLKYRAVMAVIAIAVTVSVAFIYPRIGQELVPDDDQGEFSITNSHLSEYGVLGFEYGVLSLLFVCLIWAWQATVWTTRARL